MEKTRYVGRYAPSPTGFLHLGNIQTALVAWLHARLHQGQYIIRIEDLDTPRVVQDADTQILLDLEWLGLDWDGEITYQSDRTEYYQQVFESLLHHGCVYPCYCSRKDIQRHTKAEHGERVIYPGTCRALSLSERQHYEQENKPFSCRIKTDNSVLHFFDGCHGEIKQRVNEDFIIKRADGLFSYQLAVAYDDLQQAITHVVRGSDLLQSTPKQIFLMQRWQALQLLPPASLPNYYHVPLMLDNSGVKLSKRFRQHNQSVRHQYPEPYVLLGKLANSLGLIPSAEPISCDELLQIVCENPLLINKIVGKRK